MYKYRSWETRHRSPVCSGNVSSAPTRGGRGRPANTRPGQRNSCKGCAFTPSHCQECWNASWRCFWGSRNPVEAAWRMQECRSSTDPAVNLISPLTGPKILPKHPCKMLVHQLRWPASVAGCSCGHRAGDVCGRTEDAHSREHPCAAADREEQGEHPIKATQPCLLSPPFLLKKRKKPTN